MRTKMAGGAACRTAAWLALLACLLLVLPPAHGDDAAAQARQVVDKWQNAVITVRLVVKITVSGGEGGNQEEEQKADITGTVIDPSGLTVVSLSETDPAEEFRRYMGEGGPAEQKVSIESAITDLKLRFADGKEVRAKLVLRDKDLDLAFVRPEEKLTQPAAAVDLANAGVAQMLDQVLMVDRLWDSADWATMATVDRIGAVLTKPRTMYITSGEGGSLGDPAFSLDGKIVGILVQRSTPGGSAMSSDEDLGVFDVILPAADIREVAKQAAE